MSQQIEQPSGCSPSLLDIQMSYCCLQTVCAAQVSLLLHRIIVLLHFIRIILKYNVQHDLLVNVGYCDDTSCAEQV
jgi:hypothetical protein